MYRRFWWSLQPQNLSPNCSFVPSCVSVTMLDFKLLMTWANPMNQSVLILRFTYMISLLTYYWLEKTYLKANDLKHTNASIGWSNFKMSSWGCGYRVMCVYMAALSPWLNIKPLLSPWLQAKGDSALSIIQRQHESDRLGAYVHQHSLHCGGNMTVLHNPACSYMTQSRFLSCPEMRERKMEMRKALRGERGWGWKKKWLQSV